MAVTIHPYLNFGGNAEPAFNFYKSVFGGEFSSLIRMKDTPEAPRVPDHDKDRIMHVALPVGRSSMLMASDVLESMGYKLTAGNNFYISVSTESEAEAEKVFSGLSAGGK
ncbi:MAG TPA: VOC family protein [Chryseosolibacter sp.]